ncbi:alpha/beta fold hydrolase [Ureibacillus xyleni]|nr:alpha/beta hydrolase [Ureibacillus xyleni]
MLFLHGGGVSGWMWEKQVQYFSQYQCIVPDLPEQGSSRKSGDFSIRISAELLNSLIEEKAQNKEVIVIGFSLGAQVAIEMISQKPTLIHYAIINSALVIPNPALKLLIKPFIRLSYPFIKNKTFSKIQAKALFITDNQFEKYYEESSRMPLPTLIRILEENMSYTIPEQFKTTTTNILVTVGEKENSMMKKSALKIVASNSNCKGIIINKVGHGISMANPYYFNEMIESWISKSELPKGYRVIE